MKVMMYTTLIHFIALTAILSSMGCSMSMTVGTGNRTATTQAQHSEVPETILALDELAGKAAEGAARGAVGVTP